MVPLRRWVFCARFGFAVLVQLCPQWALADSRRVVLLDPGIELERAARAALEPWRLELLVVSGPTPGATAPTTHERAREIARSQDAIAVVWASASDGGYALWMYARASEHVVARRLSMAPPFDAVSATAVALSIKTLLRHSETAPAEERYGALASEASAVARESAGARPVLPSPQPPATMRTGSTSSTESIPSLSMSTAEASAPAQRSAFDDRRPARFPRKPSNVQVDLGTSARFLLTTARALEPRFGLGATWWPRASAAGVSLRSSLGPAQTITESRFRGTLRDYGAGVLGRLRRDLVGTVRLTGAAGLCADITRLDGTALPDALAVSRTLRVVPSVALELGADWLVSAWTRIGLRAGGSWLLRTQRYLVRSEPVVELSRLRYEATFVLGLSLPSRL